MRITYVARSFLDYRIPVLVELSKLLDSELSLIYCADYVPERVQQKARRLLGDSAIGMTGEIRLGPNADKHGDWANAFVRIVYQPGILRRIAETRPDVLVGDGFFQWTTFALAYKAIHGTPLVLCYERTGHTERRAQWYRTAYRKVVLRYVDAMSCNGSLSQDYCLSLGMPRSRITLGQMAADVDDLSRASSSVTEAERYGTRSKWGGPEVVLIGVGQLVARKGWRELIQAWRLLDDDLQARCRLVIIGTGPEAGVLQSFARELGARGVVFHGSVDYDSIGRIYAAADALVVPTLEDNWSLVVPEAMACGMPILCSQFNGCHPELVQNDVNGWVFNPLDIQETARVLQLCISERERLPMMGTASRRLVSQHTPAHAARAILQACRVAVGKKR